MKKSKVFYGTYRDSVLLMKMAASIRKMPDVQSAEVMMASESNKAILNALGLLTDEIQQAANTDLAVSVIADTEDTIAKAIDKAEDLILFGEQTEGYANTSEALLNYPDANLALISIAGEYAAEEAEKALRSGMNVMIFSDNVDIEDELRIKQYAESQGLFVMGPDCGTAMINGAGLAFCNSVRRGNVGIVGASGTGTQEAMVLLDKNLVGISHAIGTGSNDIKQSIGGITMLHGIRLLQENADTDYILIIGKPTAPEVEEKIVAELKKGPKPAVVCLLGGERSGTDGNIQYAQNLEEAAMMMVAKVKGTKKNYELDDKLIAVAKEKGSALAASQRNVRALYTGGTLAGEACLILGSAMPIESNIKIRTAALMEDPRKPSGSSVVDLGDDVFTKGKPHPMIEPTLRAEHMVKQAEDPTVGVILMDFVIGYGVHEDPVGCTIPYIKQAQEIAATQNRNLVIIGYVLGTETDPQKIDEQNKMLEDCGVLVAQTNAQAAKLALEVIR